MLQSATKQRVELALFLFTDKLYPLLALPTLTATEVLFVFGVPGLKLPKLIFSSATVIVIPELGLSTHCKANIAKSISRVTAPVAVLAVVLNLIFALPLTVSK